MTLQECKSIHITNPIKISLIKFKIMCKLIGITFRVHHDVAPMGLPAFGHVFQFHPITRRSLFFPSGLSCLLPLYGLLFCLECAVLLSSGKKRSDRKELTKVPSLTSSPPLALDYTPCLCSHNIQYMNSHLSAPCCLLTIVCSPVML